MSEGFRVPAGPGESELTEKRSRFLGHLIPVESEEEAKDFIARVKRCRRKLLCLATRHEGRKRNRSNRYN